MPSRVKIESELCVCTQHLHTHTFGGLQSWVTKPTNTEYTYTSQGHFVPRQLYHKTVQGMSSLKTFSFTWRRDLRLASMYNVRVHAIAASSKDHAWQAVLHVHFTVSRTKSRSCFHLQWKLWLFCTWLHLDSYNVHICTTPLTKALHNSFLNQADFISGAAFTSLACEGMCIGL